MSTQLDSDAPGSGAQTPWDTVEYIEAGSASPTMTSAEPGDQVGRFSLLERCGAGAMGVVFTAWDPKLQRRVAIKVLDDAAHDVGQVLTEARAAAKLNHPNVVTVHDAGIIDGRSYVAMEFIEGARLDAWWKEGRTVEEIRGVFAQLARGLYAAHEADLVHRDFKPSNVLVTSRDGTPHPQILDFGLTIATGDASAKIAGTPAYMPPEQRMGECPAPSGDQYSFFVTLYEALTGERPKRPAALERIPRALRSLVARGLEAEPSSRHPNMRVVADALAPRSARSRRALALTGIMSVGAISAAVVLSSTRPSCDDTTSAWDHRVQREELRDSLARASVPFSTEGIDEALDGYAERWTSVRRDVCVATFEEGRQSEALLDARMMCLDDALVDVQALLDAVAQRPERISNAVGAIENLPAPEDCATQFTAPGPQRSPQLHEGLARLRASLELLEWPRAVELSAELRAADLRGSHAQRVELMLGSSHALERDGKPQEATKFLEEALQLAVAQRLPHLAQRVALEKLWQEGVRNRDFETAQRWASLGRAWLEAANVQDPRAAAQFTDRLGVAAAQSRDFPRAIALHREALEQLGEALGPTAPQTLSSRIHLHALLPRDSVEARELRASTAALIGETLGEQHPKMAVLLTGGVVQFEDPSACAAALPDFRRALEIKVANYGESSIDLVPVLNTIANCEGASGRIDASLAMLRRAAQILETTYGATNPRLSTTLFNLSIAELAAEEYDEALEHAQRTLQIEREALGAQNANLSDVHLLIARVALAQGGLTRAQAEFERSLALEDPARRSPYDRIETRQYLARTVARRDDPVRAAALLDEAIAIAEDLGDAEAKASLQAERAQLP